MIEQYLKDQEVNGLSQHTLKSEQSALQTANKFKLLEEWTKNDVNEYILKMQREYSKSTVESYKIILRKYFRSIDKEDIVKHLKIKACKNGLEYNQLLTTQDINKLIETTPSPFYKALIALLFESGARIQEILNLKVSNIEESNKGMIVSIPQTKTGTDFRRVLCVFSDQYIRNHISYSALSKDDLIFKLHKANAWKALVKIGRDAGIKKPCNPHALRHAQATNMVQLGYNESIIRKKLGWSGDSKMIGRYVHVCDDDVIDSAAEMAGTNIEKKPIVNIKTAEKLNIVDASAQLSKLNTENQELKSQMDAMLKMVNAIKDSLSESPRQAGMFKKWTKI